MLHNTPCVSMGYYVIIKYLPREGIIIQQKRLVPSVKSLWDSVADFFTPGFMLTVKFYSRIITRSSVLGRMLTRILKY